jgi:hypothetical protein
MTWRITLPRPIQPHHSREQQEDPSKHQHGDLKKRKLNDTKRRDSNNNPSHPAQPAGRGPTGAVNSAAHTTTHVDPRDAQLAALQAQVTAMMAVPAYGGNFGMSVYPPAPAHTHATLTSSARPRAHCCLLHGWNNSHEGNVCKVMTNDAQYTSAMRNATSEIGSGGNPKIGVPVTYTSPTFFPLSIAPCRALIVPLHTIPPHP